ncbi:MAG: hypothetical protein RSD85_01620 [Erysipelotrichaceae bacterium]
MGKVKLEFITENQRVNYYSLLEKIGKNADYIDINYTSTLYLLSINDAVATSMLKYISKNGINFKNALEKEKYLAEKEVILINIALELWKNGTENKISITDIVRLNSKETEALLNAIKIYTFYEAKVKWDKQMDAFLQKTAQE